METGKIEISDSGKVSLRLSVLEVTVDELVDDVSKLKEQISELRRIGTDMNLESKARETAEKIWHSNNAELTANARVIRHALESVVANKELKAELGAANKLLSRAFDAMDNKKDPSITAEELRVEYCNVHQEMGEFTGRTGKAKQEQTAVLSPTKIEEK